MSQPLIRTDALGGSALSRAARAGELPEWFRPVPANADEWRAYADEVRKRAPSSWYNDVRDAIQPTGAAKTRLEAAARNGLVVTTGQQPGLFGGPLMTLVKAISARALADELQRLLNIPVAPLFWAATDDADFAEASVVSVALDGGARELQLAERAAAGTPVARIPLDHDIDGLAALLRDACGSAPHRSFVDLTMRAYRDGATIGSAYVDVLRQVLEPLEMAVFDVSHPAASKASAPVMLKAAKNAQRAADAVSGRNATILTRGYAPQVDEVAGASLVFLNSGSTKRRLTIAEAAKMDSVQGTDFLSSTVLLRPVLERALFPTAAYVAGPGEMAYFAQVTAVADALGLAQPLVVPRWSTTIVEPRIQRILDEFDLAVEAFADPDAVETRVAKARVSGDAVEAMTVLRGEVQKGVERLRGAGDKLLPDSVVDGLRRTLEHKLERAERRMVAATKRRETDVMRRIATARGSLYPHGVKQERKLAFIPFLARYGSPLLDQLLEEARSHARALTGARAEGASPVAARP